MPRSRTPTLHLKGLDNHHKTPSLISARPRYSQRMGMLYYDGTAIEIDDRTLAHLKVAVVQKLRRQEAFTVSWTHPPGSDGGRSTLWMHPAIPLRFVFTEPESPELHTEWLEEILRTANSTGGIQLTREHVDGAVATT